MTNQLTILREMKIGKNTKYTVDDLVASTKLTKKQIYVALRDLKTRKLILKEKEIGDAKRGIPPKKKIYAKLNDNEYFTKKINKILQDGKNG